MNAAGTLAAARRVPRALALAAIRFYKRFVSPRKGYACAYRVHTGAASCSTLGYRAVARYGVFRGLGVLGLRVEQCRLKHARHGQRRRPMVRRAQAGFVDGDCGGCEGCDVGGCDGCGGLCDGLEIASCFCDGWGDGWCDGDNDGVCWSRDSRGCGRSRAYRTPPARPPRERGRRRRGTPPDAPLDAPPGVDAIDRPDNLA